VRLAKNETRLVGMTIKAAVQFEACRCPEPPGAKREEGDIDFVCFQLTQNLRSDKRRMEIRVSGAASCAGGSQV